MEYNKWSYSFSKLKSFFHNIVSIERTFDLKDEQLSDIQGCTCCQEEKGFIEQTILYEAQNAFSNRGCYYF